MHNKTRILFTTALTGMALAFAAPASAADPNMQATYSQVSVTGKVAAVADNQFTLDYGKDLITVEMDNWDFFRNDSRIKPGETVAVRGMIDSDLYAKRSIDASSVYVYDRATYYYPNNASPSDLGYMTYNAAPPAPPAEGTWYGLSGMVKGVTGTEILLDTGVRDVTVETAHLGYNPFDNEGFQKIIAGDNIYVTGILDHNFFDGSEIEAKSITTLARDRGKTTTTVTRTTTTSVTPVPVTAGESQ